jgi:hypothetical protein
LIAAELQFLVASLVVTSTVNKIPECDFFILFSPGMREYGIRRDGGPRKRLEAEAAVAVELQKVHI